jgi:hypothetical protein
MTVAQAETGKIETGRWKLENSTWFFDLIQQDCGELLPNLGR